jgi:hypothetical protein
VLFFIAAVRGGDLTQWLGNNAVDALRRGGKTGLLNRLGQESSALNRLAGDPVANDWRAMSLPMMFDNQMHKIALYYKNDSESQQKDQQGKQTRFIFDLSLDALGKVQLDGLFRAKRFDLIVRTLTPFSLPMQQDMRRIYSGALGETSITGDLSFQNKPEQWVTITPETIKHAWNFDLISCHQPRGGESPRWPPRPAVPPASFQWRGILPPHGVPG